MKSKLHLQTTGQATATLFLEGQDRASLLGKKPKVQLKKERASLIKTKSHHSKTLNTFCVKKTKILLRTKSSSISHLSKTRSTQKRKPNKMVSNRGLMFRWASRVKTEISQEMKKRVKIELKRVSNASLKKLRRNTQRNCPETKWIHQNNYMLRRLE